MASKPMGISFAVECCRILRKRDFCRIFFTSSSDFPAHIVFGLDPKNMYGFGEFAEKESGMVVERHDKLVIHMRNMDTGLRESLPIDLISIWPAGKAPTVMRIRLSSLDVTKPIASLIKATAGRKLSKQRKGREG